MLKSHRPMNRPAFWCTVFSLFFLLLIAGATPALAQKRPPEGEELIWPLPPEPTRIRYLYEFQSEEDVTESPPWWKQALDILAGEERQRIALRKPFGVHVDSRGRIMVTDTGWGRLVVFDPVAHQAEMWGESGPGALQQPLGVTSDAEGNVYVGDSPQKRVVCFTPEGKYLRAYGLPGELGRPVGMAADSKKGLLYVADNRLHQIVVFSLLETARVKALGERGPEPGQFNYPMDVAIGDDGNLYVMDTFNFRVQVLTPEGEFIRSVGQNCDRPGCFSRSKGIAFDSEGHFYVSDAAFNNVQIFNKEGDLLLFFGGIGHSPGKMWLAAGIDVDDQDRIYVVDQYNHRVNVYQYIRETPKPAVAPGPEGAP